MPPPDVSDCLAEPNQGPRGRGLGSFRGRQDVGDAAGLPAQPAAAGAKHFGHHAAPAARTKGTGVDYHFLSDEDSKHRRKRGDFLECCQVFHQSYWYGTLWSEVTPGLEAGKWVVLGIDVHGARAVRGRFADAITIFVRPSSREELCRRLRGRGTETEEAIQRRLAVADQELAEAGHYQYQVVNDDMDEAVREICAILTKEWEKSRHD